MKPYMTEQELLDELVLNKKIRRDTIPVGIIRERAYTSLISPYKRLLCMNYNPTTTNYLYRLNGNFNEYINMAKIDDFISNKFSIYIECFEKYFKTYVGEILAEKLNATNINCNDYSVMISFMNSIPKYEKIYEMNASTIAKLEINEKCYDLLPFHIMYDKKMKCVHADKNILLNRRRALDNLLKLNKTRGKASNKLVQHYFNKDIVPPIWANLHTLSLGDILAIYNMFQRKDRVDFTKNLLNRDKVKANQISKLSAKINLIREIRNTINHYEPLIPSLIQYKDDNMGDSIITILDMLKVHHAKSIIQGVRLIKKKKFEPIIKNDFNKKYIEYLNKILSNI